MRLVEQIQTGDFYKEYLAANKAKQRLLCVMNPSKFMACQYLIRWREREDDKIIVFSDNVFALTVCKTVILTLPLCGQFYARAMNKPFLYGGTHHEERSKVLSLFRQGHPDFKTGMWCIKRVPQPAPTHSVSLQSGRHLARPARGDLPDPDLVPVWQPATRGPANGAYPASQATQ